MPAVLVAGEMSTKSPWRAAIPAEVVVVFGVVVVTTGKLMLAVVVVTRPESGDRVLTTSCKSELKALNVSCCPTDERYPIVAPTPCRGVVGNAIKPKKITPTASNPTKSFSVMFLVRVSLRAYGDFKPEAEVLVGSESYESSFPSHRLPLVQRVDCPR